MSMLPGFRAPTTDELLCLPPGAQVWDAVTGWSACSRVGKSGLAGFTYAVPVWEVKATALGEQVGGKHYKGLAIQPAEYCQRNRLPYCESSVIRYVTRHREKNGREDIEKAIHCLQLLLDIEYPRKP